ncbi:MAG: type II toxin-antitoxin system RelE/ParE family toxin [Candidatus Binatia bacterium]
MIYVLHAFQKKSKSGIATPQKDIELIRRRLAEAQRLDRQRSNQQWRLKNQDA